MHTKKALTTLLCTILCASMMSPITIASADVPAIWAERMIPGLDGEIRSIEFMNDGLIGHVLEYDNGTNRLWSTENSGKTWTSNTISVGGLPPLGDSVEIMDVSFSWMGDRGWAVGEYTDRIGMLLPYTYEYNPYILMTDDGGKTWTNQTANIDEDLGDQGALTAVHYFTGSSVYACGENGMVLAADSYGDDTDEWEALAYGNPGVSFNDVTGGYGTGTYRIVVVGDDADIFYFDKSYGVPSATWSGATSAGFSGWHLNSVTWCDTDTDIVLAVGDHGLFAWSNDAGETWANANSGDDERWFGVEYARPSISYAVGNLGNATGLYFNDTAETWQTFDVGDTEVTAHLRDVWTNWSDNIWAGGDGGTVVQRGWSATDRASGDDRYLTALDMSADWPDGSCDTVVMATGADFPDALSASALAGTYECPLLLTGSTLSTDVRNELTRLGAETVVIVGGTAAVSQDVEDALTPEFTVDRISGDNRYHTAELVATRVAEEAGAMFGERVFIARGDGFADALAVSPFAYSQKIPVLLTNPTMVPLNTQAALTDLNIQNAVIAGGVSAVDLGPENDINWLLGQNGGSDAERWWGANRYATAAEVAQKGIDAGWGTSAFVGITTGSNFPDALGGGAVCGSSGGVMLLTAGTALSPEAATFLTTHSGRIMDIEVFGGASVVSDTVKDAADSLIE